LEQTESYFKMKIHSAFLSYFDEVCRSGSIRKAAKKLFVASSAVNRQILKKEEELGVKLFKRSHNGIELTEAGEILSQHVSRTLTDYDRTLREIEACRISNTQGITIVGQESVVSLFLPPIFLELQNQFPGLTTSFVAANGKKLNDFLLNGRADIALAFDPVLEPNIQQVASIELAVGAIVSPTHALAKHTKINLEACINYPLVLPDESWPLRDSLNKELSRITDLSNIASTTSNSMEFIRTMLGKDTRIGFQTIIGLEEQINNGTLIHIPLISQENKFVQKFTVCTNTNQEKTEISESILELLRKRLDKYNLD